MAIAQTHTPEAFERLRTTFGSVRDPWFRDTLLAAIALTRQQEATGWLLDLVANDEANAGRAQEALCRAAPSEVTLDRLKQLGRPCRLELSAVDSLLPMEVECLHVNPGTPAISKPH